MAKNNLRLGTVGVAYKKLTGNPAEDRLLDLDIEGSTIFDEFVGDWINLNISSPFEEKTIWTIDELPTTILNFRAYSLFTDGGANLISLPMPATGDLIALSWYYPPDAYGNHEYKATGLCYIEVTMLSTDSDHFQQFEIEVTMVEAGISRFYPNEDDSSKSVGEYKDITFCRDRQQKEKFLALREAWVRKQKEGADNGLHRKQN